MPKVLIAALALSLLLSPNVAPPARCASCPETSQGPPCQEFWRADAVFVGYVTGAVGVGWPEGIAGWTPHMKLTARLNVEEVFRGDLGPEVTFETDSCPYNFKEGERYLVYANRDRDGKLRQRVGHTRTRPLSEAGEDLAYMRGLSQAAAGGRIYGTVVKDAGDYYRLRGGAGDERSSWVRPAAVPGVKVVAEGKGQSYEARTDGEGRFEFTGLPAGEYRLRTDALAGHTGWDDVKVSLADRGCAPTSFHFTPRGEISGRVVSAGGQPVKDAWVVLFSADGVTEEGLANLDQRFPVMVHSRDGGHYEFGRLPAGRYYVVVVATAGEGPQNVNRRRTFYPNAAVIGEAAIITLAEGRKKTGADIQLPPQ